MNLMMMRKRKYLNHVIMMNLYPKIIIWCYSTPVTSKTTVPILNSNSSRCMGSRWWEGMGNNNSHFTIRALMVSQLSIITQASKYTHQADITPKVAINKDIWYNRACQTMVRKKRNINMTVLMEEIAEWRMSVSHIELRSHLITRSKLIDLYNLIA